MSLYTRHGDDGRTDRAGGRAAKCEPLFEAVGTLDELCAHLGLCAHAASRLSDATIGEEIAPLQSELLTAGALIASAAGTAPHDPDGAETLAAAVARMEARIDADEARLGAMEHFILAGGCEAACRLHVARAVCRRAERRIIAAEAAGTPVPDEVLRYVNRLGDLLFSLARAANVDAGLAEVIWKSQ